ncbi:MAG: hypothetical protein IT567_02145, partial [Alphaproteobacteria bacterium]|nr:hypothetical protein [Alphaproteobacteria bacterium]
ASIPVEVAREAGSAPRIFLPVLGSGAPVAITDPEAGDTLTVIPIAKPGTGLRLPRTYVEMELLASDQGLVTRALTDHAAAVQFRNGIQLGHSGSSTTDGSFILSADLPAMKEEEYLGRRNSTTLFPYAQWKRPDDVPFRDREQQLRSKIVDGLPDNANAARLALAEFYLSEAMYPEAAVMLDRIAESNPEFALSKHVPALKGLADFMRGDPDAAAVDFDNPSLDGIDEAVFWRNIIPAARDTLATPLTYDFFAQRYAAQYAPDVQRKLAFTAAEYFLAHQRYPEAQSALANIPDSDSTPAEARKYKNYLLGQIAAANNQTSTALQYWKPLSEDIEDRFIRAKAGLALTKLLMEKGRMNSQEAITQLDPLMLVWRGDQTEADVLKLLGQLRIDNQEYTEGLYAWRDLVTNFSNDPENQAYAQKMADVFLQLFNRGGADSMSPLDALTLYYEFRELTPAGEEGDTMIRNLSDRLASVDLLDRAAALLTHQIRFRLDGEEKARVGARLALIHLLNKKPDLAKEVLEASGFDKANDTLKTTRNHLMIKALAESGDYKKAMELLKDDTSATAQMLRTDVLWDMKDWPATIGYLEKLLYERELNPAPLDKLESENILRLGLAYIFGGKFKELNTLHDRFAALMAENPYNETFAFITEKHEFIDHTNFDKINDEIGSFETFMGNYKKSIENKGLSETIQ